MYRHQHPVAPRRFGGQWFERMGDGIGAKEHREINVDYGKKYVLIKVGDIIGRESSAGRKGKAGLMVAILPR